jgi:hypothetical protein
MMAKLAEDESIGRKLAQANSRIERLTGENRELKQEVDGVKSQQFAKELAMEELHGEEMRAEITSLSNEKEGH